MILSMQTETLYTSWDIPDASDACRFVAFKDGDDWYGYYASHDVGNLDGKVHSLGDQNKAFYRLLQFEKRTRTFSQFLENNTLTHDHISTPEFFSAILPDYGYSLMLQAAIDNPHSAAHDTIATLKDNHVVFRFLDMPVEQQNNILMRMNTP